MGVTTIPPVRFKSDDQAGRRRAMDDTGRGDSIALTRDELLRRSALAGIATVGGSLLVARGAGAAPRQARPNRGGVLKIAVGGGGAKDTIDAHQSTNQPDFARTPQLYESLTVRDAHFNLVNQ